MFNRAPKLSSLSRSPVVVVVEETAIEPSMKNLASEAAEVLGYHGLRRSINGDREHARDLRVVAVAFQKLGIEPLDTVAVEAYKRKMVKYLWDKNSERWEWNLYLLQSGSSLQANYDGPVPAFALERAIQIKREIPSVVFKVDTLQHYSVRHPDPFMGVALGSVFFYTDVWDEPMFEGRRTV